MRLQLVQKLHRFKLKAGEQLHATFPFTTLTIFTSEHFDRKHTPHRKISDADIKTCNAQYPKLAVRYNESFHDRFIIIDDRELYLVGASLKDLGRKCFAFTKLDAGEIRRIKKEAFATGAKARTP